MTDNINEQMREKERRPTTRDTIYGEVTVFAETLRTEVAVFSKRLVSRLAVQMTTKQQT